MSQILTQYEAEGANLKLMSDASIQKMINELPESVRNMQVGDFLNGCDQGDAELKFWGAKPFELQSDQKQNVAPEQTQENKCYRSSSEYEDALDQQQDSEAKPIMTETGVQAFASKVKPDQEQQTQKQFVNMGTDAGDESKLVPEIETIDMACQYSEQLEADQGIMQEDQGVKVLAELEQPIKEQDQTKSKTAGGGKSKKRAKSKKAPKSKAIPATSQQSDDSEQEKASPSKSPPSKRSKSSDSAKKVQQKPKTSKRSERSKSRDSSASVKSVKDAATKD